LSERHQSMLERFSLLHILPGCGLTLGA